MKNFRDHLQELHFHVRGIIDASASLRQLIGKLDSGGSSSEIMLLAETLSLLEVELLDHIGYHLREVKRPLKYLLNRAYEDYDQFTTEPGGSSEVDDSNG